MRESTTSLPIYRIRFIRIRFREVPWYRGKARKALVIYGVSITVAFTKYSLYTLLVLIPGLSTSLSITLSYNQFTHFRLPSALHCEREAPAARSVGPNLHEYECMSMSVYMSECQCECECECECMSVRVSMYECKYVKVCKITYLQMI